MLGANMLLRLIAALGILVSGVAFAGQTGGSETSPGYSLRDSIPRLERYYDLSLGKRVFTGKCLVCHGDEHSGAPLYGDRESWEARLAQGRETLIAHALNGHGQMPAKGGLESLTDDEVAAAVAYVHDRSQRLFANQQEPRQECAAGEVSAACSPRELERAMILQMLWLLGAAQSGAAN
jgi:cytochrome c5